MQSSQNPLNEVSVTVCLVGNAGMSEVTYDKTAILGQGSFGTVYLGRKSGQKTLAVKTLNLAAADITSIRKEMDIMTTVKGGPYIVQIDGYILNPLTAVITMDCAEKGSLEDWATQKDGKYLNLVQQLTITFHIAEGLDYIHSKEIIHRDLKMANVLLNEHMNPLIADFGLSEIKGKTSKVKGTIKYFSPELLHIFSTHKKEAKQIEAFDIYALALMYWTLFEGVKHPFPLVVDFNDLVHRVCRKNERVPLSNSWPQEVREVIDSGSGYDPSKRPTAKQIIEKLSNNPIIKEYCGKPQAIATPQLPAKTPGTFFNNPTPKAQVSPASLEVKTHNQYQTLSS